MNTDEVRFNSKLKIKQTSPIYQYFIYLIFFKVENNFTLKKQVLLSIILSKKDGHSHHHLKKLLLFLPKGHSSIEKRNKLNLKI